MRLHPAAPDDVRGRAVMFGGGGGTTSTNTIQNTAPWSGQQPYLTGSDLWDWAPLGNGSSVQGTGGPGVFPAAQALYTQYSPQYYPDQTVASFTPQQDAATNDTWAIANNGGTPTVKAGQASTTAIADGGQTSLAQPAYNQSQGYLSEMLSGAGGVSQALYPSSQANNYLANTINGATAGSAGSYTAGQKSLSDILGAGLDPNSNPYLSSAASSTLAQVIPQIQGQFAGGDRLDSGLASEAASAGATQALGNLNYGQYNTNVNNAETAAQTAGSQYGTQEGLQQGAASSALSYLGQQQALQQGAAGLASTNYQDAAKNTLGADALAPSYDSQTLNDIAASYNSGSAQQAQQQADINALVQKWNYGQNLPYNMLGTYANLVNGSYGTSSSSLSTQPYQSNTAANILAGVGAAGSAASGLAATGAFGSSGWLAGLLALA